MRRRRFLVSALIGLVAGALTLVPWGVTGPGGDFDWARRIAADLLAGRDPYAMVATPLNIPYPLPVAVFGLPLLLVSPAMAGAIFFGLSAAVLAYGAFSKDEPWRLLVMLSWPYLLAAQCIQVSPLIMAAWFTPSLAPLLVLIKPQIALPVALNRLTWRGIALASTVLVLSLIVYPTWSLRWLALLGPYQRTIPILLIPYGVPLVGAVFVWRNEQARLLMAMACLPYRAVYDLCTLWLIPRSWHGCAVLTILSWGLYLVRLPDLAAVPLLFLPALAMVLWPLVHPYIADIARAGKRRHAGVQRGGGAG